MIVSSFFFKHLGLLYITMAKEIKDISHSVKIRIIFLNDKNNILLAHCAHKKVKIGIFKALCNFLVY